MKCKSVCVLVWVRGGKTTEIEKKTCVTNILIYIINKILNIIFKIIYKSCFYVKFKITNYKIKTFKIYHLY